MPINSACTRYVQMTVSWDMSRPSLVKGIDDYEGQESSQPKYLEGTLKMLLDSVSGVESIG